MEIHTLILYFISSIILFLILNKTLKITKEIKHYTIISCIYILIISGIFTNLNLTQNNDSIFIVILFEMLMRICYTSLIEDKNFFIENNNIKRYIITFLILFSLNTFFIRKVKTVFLNPEQIKVIVWFLIIIYIIEILKSETKKYHKPNKIKNSHEQERKIKQEYIVTQYAKLKFRYSDLIKTNNKELIPIIYAIMIYENKNRPELIRKLDYYLYKMDRKGRKFGIMGIYSKYYIDDENSIWIATRRLEKIYYQVKKQKNIERLILKEYYQKNYIANEVLEITKEIKKFNKK